MKKNTNLLKFLVISNIALIITTLVMGYYLIVNFRNDSLNIKNHTSESTKLINLENYLRNRGLVDGRTDATDVKPYSIQEMEEFQKWYNEQQQENDEN